MLPHWSCRRSAACSRTPGKLQVVYALQDLVAELGVADALVAVQPRARPPPWRASCRPGSACRCRAGSRSPTSAPVQSRLLTIRAAFSPSKSRSGSTCARSPLHPLGDHLRVSSASARRSSSGRRSGRWSRRPGRAGVSGVLDPAHREQLDQVADMQARRGRVEPHVGGDRARRQRLAPAVDSSVDRAIRPAPAQFVESMDGAAVRTRASSDIAGGWLPSLGPTVVTIAAPSDHRRTPGKSVLNDMIGPRKAGLRG